MRFYSQRQGAEAARLAQHNPANSVAAARHGWAASRNAASNIAQDPVHPFAVLGLHQDRAKAGSVSVSSGDPAGEGREIGDGQADQRQVQAAVGGGVKDAL